MEKLIQYLKNRRKQGFLSMNHQKKYAFVGIGSHSINNLYPVIDFHRLDLKYIVTRSAENARIIDENFTHSKGTNDLDMVLNDPEVGGIFICTQPTAHFEIVKKALQANKHVFVEKPPCMTISELEELIKIEEQSTATCLTGFQKRYAPANIQLKKNLKSATTYNYRFLTGAYPEGDPFMDLFIHPINLVDYLFGKTKAVSAMKADQGNGVTVFVQLAHDNGSKGVMEISTAYSWKNAMEEMTINTQKGTYKATNTDELIFTPKQGDIFNLPKEKIFNKSTVATTLHKRSNFSPVLENNQLYSSGYFTEVKNFIELCESGSTANYTSLSDCKGTYQLMEQIRKVAS